MADWDRAQTEGVFVVDDSLHHSEVEGAGGATTMDAHVLGSIFEGLSIDPRSTLAKDVDPLQTAYVARLGAGLTQVAPMAVATARTPLHVRLPDVHQNLRMSEFLEDLARAKPSCSLEGVVFGTLGETPFQSFPWIHTYLDHEGEPVVETGMNDLRYTALRAGRFGFARPVENPKEVYLVHVHEEHALKALRSRRLPPVDGSLLITGKQNDSSTLPADKLLHGAHLHAIPPGQGGYADLLRALYACPFGAGEGQELTAHHFSALSRHFLDFVVLMDSMHMGYNLPPQLYRPRPSQSRIPQPSEGGALYSARNPGMVPTRKESGCLSLLWPPNWFKG